MVGIFILRVTLGFSLFALGFSHIRKGDWIGAGSLLSSLGIIVGIFTQGFLIAGIISIIAELWFCKTHKDTHFSLFIVLGLIALSLLFLGPGILAFDLPL
jgi:hypothetical protein